MLKTIEKRRTIIPAAARKCVLRKKPKGLHFDNSILVSRVCLCCGKKFPSESIGNRVCVLCKNSADWK